MNSSNKPDDQKMYNVQLCQKEDMAVRKISLAGEVYATLGHVNSQTFFPFMFFSKFSAIQLSLFLMQGHRTIPVVFNW